MEIKTGYLYHIKDDFFDKIIKKYKSDYLFTAHHGDDLIETISYVKKIFK